MTNRVVITAAVGLWAVALSLGVARPARAVGAAADLRPGATHAVVFASAPLSRYAAFVGSPETLVTTYRVVPKTPAPASSPTSAPTPAAAAEREPLEPSEETTYRRGALYHEIGRGAGVSVESGFNGHSYWSSNENRYVVTALEDAARRAITSNALDSGGVIPEGTATREMGSETVDGTPADIVRVTPPGGMSADLAIDHATGALRRIVFDPEDRYRHATVHIIDYKEIAPGVRVPAHFRFGNGPQHELVRGAVQAVSDAELAAPSPSSAWAFGNGDSVPIQVQRGTRIGRRVIVRASINGHPGDFLLDSGAGLILLYQPYARSLGLSMLGRTSYSGVAGGVNTARFARAETIAVGDNTLSNVVVAVSERDPSDKAPYDGILGFDLLAGALVHVDLVKGAVTFGDPTQFQPTIEKGAYAFPVNLADNTPEVLVKIGNYTTRATIDTGDDHFATLSDNLITSGRLVSLPLGTIYFTGVDGITPEPATCYKLNEISVGPYRYQGASVCLAKEAVFGKDGGLIGFDFLRHFNWTFDYTRSHVVMTPNGQ